MRRFPGHDLSGQLWWQPPSHDRSGQLWWQPPSQRCVGPSTIAVIIKQRLPPKTDTFGGSHHHREVSVRSQKLTSHSRQAESNPLSPKARLSRAEAHTERSNNPSTTPNCTRAQRACKVFLARNAQHFELTTKRGRWRIEARCRARKLRASLPASA